MAFCSNCGTKLEENEKFCPNCGTQREQVANAQNAEASAEPQVVVNNGNQNENYNAAVMGASGKLDTPSLVWSIINLIVCCQPLGIASLILTILAKEAPTAADEEKKLKAAKICNLIGTIGAAVIYFCYIIFYVFIFAMASA
ncbi:MAG: zinc-ribbon domain-containing protein [Clostridia bacterium]|nr:zinc-ribbon domain-containing protein [Clostridia bacterium]